MADLLLDMAPTLDSLAGHPAGLRRTFAIISPPDAGQTTLTAKLLLFGGAIHVAGTVKAPGAARRARPAWLTSDADRGPPLPPFSSPRSP